MLIYTERMTTAQWNRLATAVALRKDRAVMSFKEFGRLGKPRSNPSEPSPFVYRLCEQLKIWSIRAAIHS